MIAALLRFSLHQRFIVLALTFGLIGGGIWSFFQLKIEAYPDISDTQVLVVTTFPGHAAEEVEKQLTIPIERALNSCPNLIARRSQTIFGLSVVELTFTYDTNDYFARQVVVEKLRDVELPPGVVPSLGPLTSPVGEIYRYILSGGGLDDRRLRDLQDWTIAPRIFQVDGVADVTPFGGLVKQYQIELDPNLLSKYGLTASQVEKAVGANNTNGGGAFLDNQQQSMVVRGVGLIRNTADIEAIVVTAVKGTPVFVRDIGQVRIGSSPPTGVFGLNGRTGGVEGIVLLRRGENPSDVLANVKEAVDDLNQNRLPDGVRIQPTYDRADLVNNTIGTVSRTLIEGLTIVVLMLLFTLGSFRAAILAAIVIPLSLLFAFVCMQLSGIPANLLSLGAIDFGIIVDGTVVLVEHIVRTLNQRSSKLNPGSALASIREAALEVQSPIFFSLLIIICAYIPLFTLERVERRLFTPMAFTVCYALIGSLLLTLTLVPVLATYLFRNAPKTWENPLLERLYDGYERVLRATMRRPWFTVLAGAALVAGSLFLGTRLGSEFLPQLDEGTIWIRANLPPGISIGKSSEIAGQMRTIIGSFPEVRFVSSQSGRNDSGTEPFGPNRNEFFIALKPYSEWPEGKTKAILVDELSSRLSAEIPGVALNITQPIIDMVTAAVTGSSADLAVIISGEDLLELRRAAESTLTLIRAIPGAADASIEQEADQPQLSLRVDREKVARFGLNVQDVQDVVELAIGGRTVSTLFEDEKRFDITVRYIPAARSNISSLGAILVSAPDGSRIPLSQLADIHVHQGSSVIARRDNRRFIAVRTNIRGRDQGSFVKETQARFAQANLLPSGYQVNWGGQFENLDRARRRLTVIIPVTVLIIFAILFMAFTSASNAAIVLVNVPFSLVGGILFLYFRQINLSVSAAVGFISLFGISVMSGVLYVSEINRRRHQHMHLAEAIITGARAQFRPRLALIVVALLGMVPAARMTGIGSDVQRPLATVVVGGLLSTLLLTLIVMPSLYYLVARREAGPNG